MALRFGMMQGRLLPSKDGRLQSFPGERWAEEFRLARRARIDCLEWLYDSHDAAGNPLSTREGRADIRQVVAETGVPVASVCAHWFVEHPLLGAGGPALQAALDQLAWLQAQARDIGAGRIVLPLEAVPGLPGSEWLEAALAWVGRLAPLARPGSPRLALEASCPLPHLARLAAAARSQGLGWNYDIGNSAGLGLDLTEELERIGEALAAIHLKDKPRGGGSVPLGRGDADFPALGRWLRRTGYSGDLVLEAARGPVGEEIPWTLGYRDLLDHALMPERDSGPGGERSDGL